MPSALPNPCAVPTHAPASNAAAYGADVLSCYGAYSSSIANMVKNCTVNPKIVMASFILVVVTKTPRYILALALFNVTSSGSSSTITLTITSALSGAADSVHYGWCKHRLYNAGFASTFEDSSADTISVTLSVVAITTFLCLVGKLC